MAAVRLTHETSKIGDECNTLSPPLAPNSMVEWVIKGAVRQYILEYYGSKVNYKKPADMRLGSGLIRYHIIGGENKFIEGPLASVATLIDM